ncbi:MAG: hypothetical protein WCA98_04065 [Candidatus Acidiferrales bacterium]
MYRYRTADTTGDTVRTADFNGPSTMVYAIQPTLISAESMKVDIEI